MEILDNDMDSYRALKYDCKHPIKEDKQAKQHEVKPNLTVGG